MNRMVFSSIPAWDHQSGVIIFRRRQPNGLFKCIGSWVRDTLAESSDITDLHDGAVQEVDGKQV